jgi:hypothetical protein
VHRERILQRRQGAQPHVNVCAKKKLRFSFRE